MRPVETQDLVEAVRSVTDTKRQAQRFLWAIAWSDEIREWFKKHDLDAGERADHPGEALSWNARYWHRADNSACDGGLLHKWKRERDERRGWATEEVGWSLPDSEHYKQAEARAHVQGFNQVPR
jgi:hypothetical protein